MVSARRITVLLRDELHSVPFQKCEKSLHYEQDTNTDCNLKAILRLKRVIVTPAVYPRLDEPLHFDIQSTGQKSHCVNITL